MFALQRGEPFAKIKVKCILSVYFQAFISKKRFSKKEEKFF
jgi:hypothetical protein